VDKDGDGDEIEDGLTGLLGLPLLPSEFRRKFNVAIFDILP